MAERMLCISYDVSLLRTRKMLLEDAGCEVVTAEGFALAIAVCRAEGGRLDLIILCHSIAREGSNRLISHVRAARAPVLALLRGMQPAVPGAARAIVSLDPKRTLECGREMLQP